jgi:IclR family transcriptional regulator, KDG regulon repressor
MIPRDTPGEEIIHIKKKPADLDTGKTSSFKAIARTAQILRSLQKGEKSVTDIALELGVHKSTSLRLLQALEKADIVIRNKINRRYYIGTLIAELAADPDVTHEYLVSCAQKPMEDLSRLTGESIGLNILIGLTMVLLHEIPSIFPLQVIAKKKVVTLLHAGSSNKVLLAQLKPKDLAIALNNLSYEPITERTVTNKEELRVQIDRIREDGYSITYGERVSEAMDIAMPISNYFIPCSVGILGLESRMKPRTAEFLKAIQETRIQIEKKISETLI